MARHIGLGFAVAGALAASLAGHPAAATSPVDAAFDPFWTAASPQAASGLVDGIVRSGVTFDDAYRRLQHGRAYAAQKTGAVQLRNTTSDGVEHFYALNVPDTYDPARRYQARIQLHGGVGGRRTNAPVGTGTVGALTGAEQIYIIPYAWDDDAVVERRPGAEPRRHRRRVPSASTTSTRIASSSRVCPTAEPAPTRSRCARRRRLRASCRSTATGWSSRCRTSTTARYSPNNLRNKPFFAVNGGRDPLYPTRIVDPHIAHMKEGGVSVDYHPQPNAAHNTAWWPEVKDTFEAFVHDHPRVALPDTLTWETGDPAAHNRAHWLVIDALGSPRAGDAMAMSPDLNDLPDRSGRRLRRAVERHAHRPRDAGLERRACRPQAARHPGPRQRRERADLGRCVRRARRAEARDAASSCWSRETICRSSCPAPTIRRSCRVRRATCSRGAGPPGRVDLDAQRQHRAGDDARRRGVHAAALARSVRFPRSR